MQELGEECLKPICKAVRRIREEVGPHGDRGCKLQKQQNGGMLTSNMFHLSVFLSRSLLFRLEQAQQVHTHEKETSSPRTTYNHPRVTGLNKRCSSQKNHTPGRTNKVQVIPEPRLVLRWAMPCFLASRIPTAPLCSRHQTKHLGIQGVHSLVNETETICEQNCYKKDCLTSHLPLARL